MVIFVKNASQMSEKNISKEKFEKIGSHLRILRKQFYKCGYIEFAQKVGIDKKTYYNMEKPKNDYSIGNLIKVLEMYDDMNLSTFFREAEL
jgi:DNA-binding XRE family transcriptional regulator